MSAATPAPSPTPAADLFVRLGRWLFPRRTWIPQPIILLLVLVPAQALPVAVFWVGMGIVLAGEILRLQAVRHIGVISRTRSERLGPLVSSGPFAWVRNPLYIGNIALWVGFAVSARLLWLAPVIAGLLAVEYHAIVRWEEGLLESRLGAPYRFYMALVPRWIPRRQSPASSLQPPAARLFTWHETLFSERGTLMAIVAGYVLLWLKDRV